MLVFSNGNQRLIVEADIERCNRLVYIEFVVFICFVANHAYSQTKHHGFLMPFTERVTMFMQYMLPKFDLQWTEVPEKLAAT